MDKTRKRITNDKNCNSLMITVKVHTFGYYKDRLITIVAVNPLLAAVFEQSTRKVTFSSGDSLPT